ncbi:MAG: glycosyltransferase [Candidatus Nanopelagicaceae bacterium]|nr:glycosyltransferase [Candidatus Nanopelagicaceae bacterium]
MAEHVTIVTVNHDAKRFIELCVKAVHLRTKQPYRHVVIDNGSSLGVIHMLQQFGTKQLIQLLQRNVTKHAAGHAQSLDWFLHKPGTSGLICLLDSDAYPIVDDWLGILMKKLDGYGAVGCAHFRDESLLHPCCMLFRHEVWSSAGRPSFNIKKIGGKFMDTGMQVCKEMLKVAKLNPIERTTEIGKLVRHFWCGTRIEAALGDKLDGRPKAEWFKDVQKWFDDPRVKEILNELL